MELRVSHFQGVVVKATEHLSKEIKRQGRQMQTLADLIGVSPGQFSKIVNGTRTTDPITASKIAAALGWPLLFLFELPNGSKSKPSGSDEGKAA